MFGFGISRDTILDQDMAPQTSLMACIMGLAKFKYTLSIETETRPDGPSPLDLSPLIGTEYYNEQEKDIKHSHVCCYTFINDATRLNIETLPLPEIQPKCPPGWSAEAWDERVIYGTTEYHFYCSGLKPDDCLAVKVADRRENEKWVYVSVLISHLAWAHGRPGVAM